MTTETLAAAEQQVQLDLDALIRELDAGVNRLPEDALRTCQAHRNLVTPRLIEVLQEAVKLGHQGTVREGNAHFFALFLLTEFEAKQALPVILELYSLRDPVLDGLLGGAVTETTRRVLAVLAADQPDLIEAMILAPDLDEYIRWEAAATLCQLVRDEHMPRAEAIERLSRQIKSAAQAEDVWGVSISVCELGELNPLEVQDEIKAIFDKQLVDEFLISWNCFEDFLLHPEQPGTCPQFSHWKPGAIADTVEELRSWYCFSEAARRPRPARPSVNDRQAKTFLSDFEPPVSVERDEVDYGSRRIEAPRVGRNDPCPCGSGKKFKKCCLRAKIDT